MNKDGMLRPALVLFLLLTLVTGVAYPLAVTGLAQLLFDHAPLECWRGRRLGVEAQGAWFEGHGRV